MKVIHILRKPCSEGTVAANVLRHGTGALNVDATRIHSGPSEGGNTSGETALGQGSGWNAHNNRTTAIDRTMSAGRWPANLVLQHLPTCEQTGTREEPGYTVNRFTDGAKPFGGGAGHPYESEHVPPSTVPVWACGAGCPVAGLDAQHGDTGGASRFFKQVGGAPKPPTDG